MIESFFIRVLNMSLTAGIAIAAVLLLRVLLRKAPRIFSYALWAVVLFRLLCPISFSAPFSLFGAVGARLEEQGRMVYLPESLNGQWQTVLVIPDSGSAARTAPEPEAPKQGSFLEAACAVGARIWLGGIAVMLGYSLWSLLRFQKKLSGAVWIKDNIYEADALPTPFVLGFFRPRIYLPSALTEAEREYVLLHEQIHVRRKDPALRLLGYFALCLHWFNPMVWAAYWASGRDMEMSCDEAVIKTLGDGVKKAYSASLLNFAAGKRVAGGAPLAFGEENTGQRIKNVLRYKKPALWTLLAAAAACAALAAVLLSNPEDAAKEAAETNAGNLAGGEDGDRGETAGSKADDFAAGEADGISEEQQESAFGDGTYEVSVRTVSTEERAIDSYAGEGEEALAFAADCAFTVNYQMAGVQYEEVSFETFAALINESDPYLNKPCLLTFRGGEIVKADLESAWIKYGISSDNVPGGGGYTEFVRENGEESIRGYYALVSTLQADVSDDNGPESAEIYAGDQNDGNGGGYVLIKNADGDLIWVESLGIARAGWGNVYFGEKDGVGYIMTLHIEDREEYGEYAYAVFRVAADGWVNLIANSAFSWGGSYEYDDGIFREWVSGMESYLESSYLVLSTQDGTIRTQQVSEADRYNYETLSLKDR